MIVAKAKAMLLLALSGIYSGFGFNATKPVSTRGHSVRDLSRREARRRGSVLCQA